MKPTNKAHDDALDRILEERFAAPSDEMTPSSGFAASVMQAVREGTEAPQPIGFPWRRALPGLIASLCGLIAFAVVVLRSAISSGSAGQTSQSAAQVAASFARHVATATLVLESNGGTLGWVLLASALSVAAIAASFRIANRSY